MGRGRRRKPSQSPTEPELMTCTEIKSPCSVEGASLVSQGPQFFKKGFDLLMYFPKSRCSHQGENNTPWTSSHLGLRVVFTFDCIGRRALRPPEGIPNTFQCPENHRPFLTNLKLRKKRRVLNWKNPQATSPLDTSVEKVRDGRGWREKLWGQNPTRICFWPLTCNCPTSLLNPKWGGRGGRDLTYKVIRGDYLCNLKILFFKIIYKGFLETWSANIF